MTGHPLTRQAIPLVEPDETGRDPRLHPEWVEDQEERISAGKRPPASLGEIIDRDIGDATYIICYEDESTTTTVVDDETGDVGSETDVWMCEEAPWPMAPDNCIPTSGVPWTEMWLPIVSPWESLLLRHRFGKVQRQILRLIFDSNTGTRQMGGQNLAYAIEQSHAVLENRKANYEENRLRAVNNAARQLARSGIIHIFMSDNPVGPEDEYLMVFRPALVKVMRGLLDKYPEEFGRSPAEEEDESDPFTPPPINLAESKDNSIEFYRQRSIGRNMAPIDEDGTYPEQPYHITAKYAVGIELGLVSTSREMTTEIDTETPLSDYFKIDRLNLWSAIEEIRATPSPTNEEDVRECLKLLTTADQKAVLHYVTCWLTDTAKQQIDDLAFEGTHGIDLVVAAIAAVPKVRKQRAHVLRQVRLLVGDILRDLISYWNSQIVGVSEVE